MKITTQQKSEIISMIKANLITLSIANDMCETLGFGRCIHFSDLSELKVI